MFYFNIYIILNNIILDIFLYPREIEVIRYFFKYFLNFLIPTRAFRFIVNFKNLFLSIYRDINLVLESKESKIYFIKEIMAINIFIDFYCNFIF